MLKPGGGETKGGLQMLQVTHHVSSPRQTVDGGVQGLGGGVREGQGGGGEWSLGRFRG